MSYELEDVIIYVKGDLQWKLGFRYALWVETDFGIGQLSVSPASGSRVRIDDWWVPERFRVRAEFHELPYVVELDYEVAEQTRPECIQLTLQPWPGPAPILTEGFLGYIDAARTTFTRNRLRSLPVADLECLARRAAMRRGRSMAATWDAIGVDDWADLIRRPVDEQVAPTARRRKKVEIDLNDLARVYNSADRNPVAAVEKHFHVSRSTANRRVKDARRRGLLTQARKEPAE